MLLINSVFVASLIVNYVNGQASLFSVFPENFTSLMTSVGRSEKCVQQLQNLDTNTKLIMFDASTKIPSGLLGGNYFDLGNFNECYRLKVETKVGIVYGKYCLGTVPLATGKEIHINRKIPNLAPNPRILTDETTLGLHYAICVPNGCTAQEISSISNYFEEFCYSQDTRPELSPGAIATIVVISIFLGFVVLSTVYEVYIFYRKQKPHHELLIAFSAFTNGKKLITSAPKTNSDLLLCLNGIKAISMIWVVAGHTYSETVQAPVMNNNDYGEFVKDPVNMFMNGGTVSVDSFFLVGGCVTVYTYLKAKDACKTKWKFNIPLYYLHRYLRLTPAFAATIFVYGFILVYLGVGPLWGEIDYILGEPCRTYWWSSMFYIMNYVKQEYCMPQSWYLSADMQLFLVSPIVLLPLGKWPKYGLGLLGILIGLGVIIPFVIGYVYELGAFLSGDEKYTIYYYIQPYTRFGPYVIGMLLGYYLFKLKKCPRKFKLKPMYVLILWLISLTGLVACVYAPHDAYIAEVYDRWSNSLYLAFNRNAWAVSLGLMIFLCVSGYGGPIDSFLSHSIFQFLSKVSYSMYLVHYAVIKVKYSSSKTLMHFSNIDMMMGFWGIFMWTLAISVVLCLTFESPIITIEKFIFGGNKRKRVKNENA